MEVGTSLDGGAGVVAAMAAADDDAVVKQEPPPPPAMQQQVLLKSSNNVPNGNGGGGCRLPRWSRHETLVLVEAKKAEEARLKNRQANGADPGGSNKAAGGESKWYSIATFCKRRGADRQAKHCRKRWSNLFGDYKRIKEWQMLNGSDSFWVMRNDLRKEKKLPGAFDREVFDALEDFMNRKPSFAAGSVLDGPRITPDEGLFSDIEHPVQEDPIPNVPTTERSVPVQDSSGDKPQTNSRKKRKRTTHLEAEDQNDQFLNVLECNCKALAAHIDAQNVNSELDRAQKKELADDLLSVLGKLTEALAKIAEKL